MWGDGFYGPSYWGPSFWGAGKAIAAGTGHAIRWIARLIVKRFKFNAELVTMNHELVRRTRVRP